MNTQNDFQRAMDYYESGHFQEALDIWKGMTDNAIALYNAGCIYYGGKVQTNDRLTSAFDCFYKSSELNYAPATFYCGYIYELLGPKSYDEAAKCYHKCLYDGDGLKGLYSLAEKGHLMSQYLLGNLYYEGGGDHLDRYQESEKWCLKAYNNGDRYFSPCVLGHIYKDYLVDKDKAFFYFKTSANAGNHKAFGPLGDCYRVGLGTGKNYTEAINWYTKGANSGHEDARFFLGLMHLCGMGCKPNRDFAVSCFDRVVNSNNAKFTYFIGLMYYRQYRGLNDKIKAINLFKKSAEGGFQLAIIQLGKMYYFGEDVVQDYNQAFRLFKSIEKDPVAQEYLGHCYYFGHGCQKDTTIAKSYFKKSIDGGNDSARKYLNSDMELKPYSKWELEKDGAEILGGAAAFILGTILSSFGDND